MLSATERVGVLRIDAYLSARAHARRARDRRLRVRARERAPLHQRAVDEARSSSCAARPRASTSSRRAGAGATSSAGDEIVITWLEHHANIVPWQQLCAEKGARLRVAPVDDRGQVILEEYEKLLGPKTRLVSFTQVSNALGTITPAREMIEMAHRHGARRAPRRRAGRLAHARRRAGARLRLLRLLRPQGVRADGHRRRLRQAASCSRRCRRGKAAAT